MDPTDSEVETPVAPTPWPKDAIGQITVLRQIAAGRPITVGEAIAQLTGATAVIVTRHLETPAILGEVRALPEGRFAAVSGVGAPV